jgi:hypothetical protein
MDRPVHHRIEDRARASRWPAEAISTRIIEDRPQWQTGQNKLSCSAPPVMALITGHRPGCHGRST